MSMTDIVLERETANDESAVVVAIHVASGTAVRQDDVIFDIENSKATQEVLAPETGILRHTLQINQTVDFGVPIGQIISADEWTRIGDTVAAGVPAADPAPKLAEPVSALELPPAPARAASPAPAAVAELLPMPAAPRRQPGRVSHAAAVLLAEAGLSAADFAADFITARDVRARLAPPHAAPAIAPPRPEPAPSTPSPGVTREQLDRRKASEIEVLSKGAGQTMLSVLGTTLGTLPIARPPGDFLDGRITDLVIYEASRLMRKYPRLNGFYEDGARHLHDAVHAGLAIDSGGNLVVCGLEATDRATLAAIQDGIADAVARYLNNGLKGPELQRATFTVTDLSASELDFVLPLLPRRQSCILGVTHSAVAGYRLFAGFDHRVTEGREAGLFLSDLRERLLSFAAPATAGTAAAALHCGFCDRSLADSVGRGKDKGLLKVVAQDGRDTLCCASCWNGW